MTKEEAIEIIKKNKPTLDPRECGKELCEACDVVIEATEKQVPKKPKIKHYEENGEQPYTKICCPNGCNIQLYPVTEKHMAYEHVYCPKCGQKISWEKNE